jgi:hypothetical protein
VCDGDGVLVSCALPTELKVNMLYLEDKGTTGIATGAFEGLAYVKKLSLSHNDVTTLRAGGFEGLLHSLVLDLSSNNISAIEAGAFRGLRSLRTLLLRANPLTVLHARALDEGADGLGNLFLDDCGRLREVEAGALPDMLDYVWLPGAALDCSQIAQRLPSGTACLDSAYCDCDTTDYLAGECALDGGDC